MVQDVKIDRTDEERGVVSHSRGLTHWEELETLSSLVDAGRELWSDRYMYMHWADGLETQIDWILTAECWGLDIWRDMRVEWCPWSDYWSIMGWGSFRGGEMGLDIGISIPPCWWRNLCRRIRSLRLWLVLYNGEVLGSLLQ